MADAEGACTGLACALGEIPDGERAAHVALIRHLFGEAVRERLELAEGYAFRFAGEEFTSVARFVANERKCCPFLTFQFEVAPEGGPLWLRINGPSGAKELIAAELRA